MFDGTYCWAGVSDWQGTNVVDIHIGVGQAARRGGIRGELCIHLWLRTLSILEVVGLDFCMCDLFRSFRSVTRRGGACMDGRIGPPRPIVDDPLDAGAKKGTRRE